MSFEVIKNFLQNKKRAELKKTVPLQFYVIQKKRSRISFVVDEKFLLMMLIDGGAPEDILTRGYANRCSVLFSSDGYVYKKYILNENGLKEYNTKKYKKAQTGYSKALDDALRDNVSKEFAEEKTAINQCCSKNLIQNIYKYGDKKQMLNKSEMAREM